MKPRRAYLIVLAGLVPLMANAQQQRVDVFANPENLRILPEDISSRELSDTMRGFAMGLGVRCETCHVGEAGQPLETFDFPSDEKPMKQKARLMLRMVGVINNDLVPQLDDVEQTDRVSVRCMTCHRGQSKPRMIEDVLDEKIAADSIDTVVTEYKSLREQFYGSHSYDFSEFVLPMYTQGLIGRGESEAAIALAELNAEYYPDSYYTALVLGELYTATGNAESAIASFTRAIELNPRAESMLKSKISALTAE
jgi:tetratricopeptide (TPR) repeat protein